MDADHGTLVSGFGNHLMGDHSAKNKHGAGGLQHNLPSDDHRAGSVQRHMNFQAGVVMEIGSGPPLIAMQDDREAVQFIDYIRIPFQLVFNNHILHVHGPCLHFVGEVIR
jgi:hypothetical protein